MKYICIALFFPVLFTTSCNGKNPSLPSPFLGGIRDSFTIQTDSEKVNELMHLCMIWGLIKYYHPDVAAGKYNMDRELLIMLPKVVSSKSKAETDSLFAVWIDSFGIPDKCNDCFHILDSNMATAFPDSIFSSRGEFSTLIAHKLMSIINNKNKTLKHFYVSEKPAGNMEFTNETIYAGVEFPNVAIRLIALFRYWNVIEYFYPYRYLLKDWKKTLCTSIPEFINCKNKQDYWIACTKLTCAIHDAHSRLVDVADTRIRDELFGTTMMPFMLNFADKKWIITDLFYFTDKDDSLKYYRNISLGDEILEINGVPIDTLVKKYLPLTSGSNLHDQYRDMPFYYLMRTKDSCFVLKTKRHNKIQLIKVPGLLKTEFDTIAKNTAMHEISKYQALQMINGDIALITPFSLNPSNIDSLEKAITNTKAIIFDMRRAARTDKSNLACYALANWLVFPIAKYALFSKTNISLPGYFSLFTANTVGNPNGPAYKGKVIVIVNESVQSSAETLTMALQQFPGCITIGDSTAGANGNISFLNLPGNIRVFFSGLGVYYPNGNETQQIGLKIDKYVHRSINGIAVNEDELLDEAIKIIGK